MCRGYTGLHRVTWDVYGTGTVNGNWVGVGVYRVVATEKLFLVTTRQYPIGPDYYKRSYGQP